MGEMSSRTTGLNLPGGSRRGGFLEADCNPRCYCYNTSQVLVLVTEGFENGEKG